jgi:hypothetical protein
MSQLRAFDLALAPDKRGGAFVVGVVPVFVEICSAGIAG